MNKKRSPKLLRYREVIEKEAIGLEGSLCVRSYVRLWDLGFGYDAYQVTAHQLGSSCDYFTATFLGLKEAQKAYRRVLGVIANAKAVAVAESY